MPATGRGGDGAVDANAFEDDASFSELLDVWVGDDGGCVHRVHISYSTAAGDESFSGELSMTLPTSRSTSRTTTRRSTPCSSSPASAPGRDGVTRAHG
jgi:hypothetical protein